MLHFLEIDHRESIIKRFLGVCALSKGYREDGIRKRLNKALCLDHLSVTLRMLLYFGVMRGGDIAQ